MRPRDLARLAATPYDVLVVGGGIHGLACAYEAASRGLSVALVDAGDFGGGATFNHQKTAHGGLRSLQSLSVLRARDAVRERRALARIAPWLLRPLPFLIGTYRSLMRGRLALRAAFALDDWIGRSRNLGLEPELHLPRPRLLSRTATLKLFPGVRQDRLTGGAQWYDYQMVENDRLTFAFAAAADAAGADLANYVAARAPLRSGSDVTGMRVHDALAGDEFNVQAKVIVNAAGAATGGLLKMFGIDMAFPLVKAMNLVTSRPAADIALAAPAPDGRMLTLVPWRGRAIVGTSQSSAAVDSEDHGVRAAEIEKFIGDVNHAFPALKLGIADVTLVHRGLVPAVVLKDGSVDLRSNSEVLEHGRVVTIVGTKYSSARRVAERAVNLVGRKLERRLPPSRTATRVLPGAGIADHEALAIEKGRRLNLDVPAPLIRHLAGRYGEGAASIISLLAERPEMASPLSAASPTIGAEVIYAIRHEGAMRLSDVVLRRTTIGAAGHPGADALHACAAIAAAELGWSDQHMRDEIAAVERIYAVE